MPDKSSHEAAKPQSAPRTPDAVLFPTFAKTGETQHQRISSVAAPAEALLGVKPVYVRGPLPGQEQAIFVTGNPNDCRYMPIWHDKAGQDRYEWADGPGGVKLGHLLADAPTADEIAAAAQGHFAERFNATGGV